jgi:hypothetical protein
MTLAHNIQEVADLTMYAYHEAGFDYIAYVNSHWEKNPPVLVGLPRATIVRIEQAFQPLLRQSMTIASIFGDWQGRIMRSARMSGSSGV